MSASTVPCAELRRGGSHSAFRFYEELNAKHMSEATGVPHTEVERVLVNGESAGFGRLLADGDRGVVYPKFESLDGSKRFERAEEILLADLHAVVAQDVVGGGDVEEEVGQR